MQLMTSLSVEFLYPSDKKFTCFYQEYNKKETAKKHNQNKKQHATSFEQTH
jgi:hypothetical protein